MYRGPSKTPTHARYLDLVRAMKDGIDIKSTQRETLDYLVTLIGDIKEKSLMKEARVILLIEDKEKLAYKLGNFLNFSMNHSIPLTRTAALLGKAALMGMESRKTTIRKRNITRVKVGIELLDLLRKEKKLTFRREPVEKPDVSKMSEEEAEKAMEAHKKARSRAEYQIKSLDEEFLFKLNISFYHVNVDVPVFTQPLLAKPKKWKDFYHPEMGEMVRNIVDKVHWEFSPEKTPKVFEFMNKIRKQAFKVNTDLLEVFEACKGDLIFTYANKRYKPKQLDSIIDQQNEVFKIANSLGKKKFYLSSFLDFRGRFYYANTYFHPQGNRVARSLFLFKKKKAIGEDGWFGLLAAAASEYGKKLSKDGKHQYSDDRLDDWILWAKDPLNNKGSKDKDGNIVEDGWQMASNPYSFLSIILELLKAYQNDGGVFDYESNLPIFIDASNSGTQILSALGRDRVGGALCNLTDSEELGDIYTFIADKVWPSYTYTDQEKLAFTELDAILSDFQDRMDTAHEKKNWKKLKVIQDEYAEFYEENKADVRKNAPVFWSKVIKHKRKICKRPVMTIPYSAGPRTIAKAIYSDWRPEEDLKGITGTYCFDLAFKITAAYETHLKTPTQLMELFQELGKRAFKKGKDLSFDAPVTGFPFVQNARKDKIERVKFVRDGRRIRLNVCVGKDEKVDYRSALSASSPNSIHALDAAFMMTIVLNAQYPMMCVHDSFATYPGDYTNLHTDVRRLFVDMFEKDVLMYILAQCNSVDLYDTIDKGDLNLDDVLNNQYCFDV